jgi:hypothetical protein
MSAAWASIVDYDPPALLIERFGSKHDLGAAQGLGEEASQDLFSATAQFIAVIADSEADLTPSPFIEAMWTDFILYTAAYHEFCDRLGGYVDHRLRPSGWIDNFYGPEYAATYAAVTAAFGVPDERWWPAPGGRGAP